MKRLFLGRKILPLMMSLFLFETSEVVAQTNKNSLQLMTYVTEWGGYGEYKEGSYKPYPLDNSYPSEYHSLKRVSNPDMRNKLANNDVVAYAFLQVWNPKAPQKQGIVVPAAWAGRLHFDDLWANLPSRIASEYPTWNRVCAQFSGKQGNPECSAVQMNGMTQQLQMFDYSQEDIGQMNNFDAFLKLTSSQANPVKKVISIGGANTTDNNSVSMYSFQAIFENQTVFIESLSKWYNALAKEKIGFDGVDYDLEPPIDASGGQLPPGPETKQDYKNLFNLVKATRAALGEKAFISVTITSNKEYLAAINDSVEGGWFKQIAPYVDAVNMMTYDLHGAWSTQSDPGAISHIMLTMPDQSFIPNPKGYAINYATSDIIDQVLSYGIAPNKVQLGLASYGRGFANVNPGKNVNYPGFDQPWSGMSQFDAQYTNQAGLLPYKSVPALLQTAGYKSYDLKDKLGSITASYIYNSSTKQLVGYLSKAAVKSHCDYAKSKGLRGAILWSMDTDAEGAESLTQAYSAC